MVTAAMHEPSPKSRWVSQVYLGVAVVVLVTLILAAWWWQSRNPERQAKRWGLVQQQAIRQARDHLRDQLKYLDQSLRVLTTLPAVIEPPEDLRALNETLSRSLALPEIDGIELERYGADGQILFDIRPPRLPGGQGGTGAKRDRTDVLEWANSPESRGATRLSLERATTDYTSDTRLFAEAVVSVWSADGAQPLGILLIRFPVKDFLAAFLIPSQLTAETYSFVIELPPLDRDVPVPASVLWHFRQPAWADVYVSATDPFITVIRRILGDRETDQFHITDIPQGDEGTRREIVSTVEFRFGDRRWVMGLSTPYNDAVLSTRGQQILSMILAGLSVAVLATGFILLSFQRTQLEIESAEQRRAQVEQLRHNYQDLFAENPTAMFVLRSDGAVVNCNLSAERLIGKPLDRIRNQPLREFIESDSMDKLWVRLLTAGQFVAQDVVVRRPSDPRDTLLEAWGRKIGEYFIIMAQDVEKRREIDRQVARLRRMDSVGSLASTMAHDFNNILGQLQILVSSLRSDLPDDSHLHGDLATIEDKIEDASLLVGNLLSFRENVLSDQPIYPDPILVDFVDQLDRLLPKSITLESEIRPDLPSIWLTAASVRRILDNLVRNAVDAMPSGGVLRIHARGQQVDEQSATDQVSQGHYCVIEVSDTGVGMSPTILDSIFEPYFTTKSEGKGTGLGLWTIYKILRRARGAIDVKSELGQGTKFTLYLAHERPSQDIDSPGLEVSRPVR